MLPIVRLGHVGLHVSALEPSVAFYGQLGFEVVAGADTERCIVLRHHGGVELTLTLTDRPSGPGLTFGLVVRLVEQQRAVLDRAGIPYTVQHDQNGHTILVLTDPDGVTVELGESNYHVGDRTEPVQSLDALSTRLGLSTQPNRRVAGRRDGVEVCLWQSETTLSIQATVDDVLPFRLRVREASSIDAIRTAIGLGDLQMETSLDREYTLTSAQPQATRRLLTDPGVHLALIRLRALPVVLQIDDNVLTLIHPLDALRHLEAHLDEAVALVRCFLAAGRGVWEQVAQRRELVIDADARDLQGTLRGVSLRAQLKVAQRFTRTEITVRLRSALPSGTQVAHIDHLQGGEPLHGDPILSTALAATSDDLETLLSVLSRPDVRGPLLAVLHGHPGSRLTTDRVQLVAQGRLGRALPTALDDLVDLVCALDA